MRLLGNAAFGVVGLVLAILWLAGLTPLRWWSAIAFALIGVRSLAAAIVEWDDRRSAERGSREEE